MKPATASATEVWQACHKLIRDVLRRTDSASYVAMDSEYKSAMRRVQQRFAQLCVPDASKHAAPVAAPVQSSSAFGSGEQTCGTPRASGERGAAQKSGGRIGTAGAPQRAAHPSAAASATTSTDVTNTSLASQPGANVHGHHAHNTGIATAAANSTPSPVKAVSPCSATSSSVGSMPSYDKVTTFLAQCTPALWTFVLGSFFLLKRKVSLQALLCVEGLLQHCAAAMDLMQTMQLCTQEPETVAQPMAGAATCNGGNGASTTAMLAFVAQSAMPTTVPNAAITGAATMVRKSGGGGGNTALGGGGGGGAALVCTRVACTVAEGLYAALIDCLATLPEATVQLRVLDLLEHLLTKAAPTMLRGRSVTNMVQTCIGIALRTTTQDAAHARNQRLLELCVHRVVARFLFDATTTVSLPGTFKTATVLRDYVADIHTDTPYTRVDVTDCLPCDDAAAAGGPHDAPVPALPSCDPNTHGDYGSLADVAAETALHVMAQDGTASSPQHCLPEALKDCMVLMLQLCRLASTPCSTGPASESNGLIFTRLVALRLLELLLDDLPVANCVREHRAATWLSLVLYTCKADLVRCLVRNFAMPAPFSLFELAIRVLGQVMRKLHYHLARELHTMLAVYLLPLVASPYADFRQKHAVLAMIHELVGIAHVAVSYFVNYDCSPSFDADGSYGGLLELLIDFVTEVTFMDVVDDGGAAPSWLSSDQQQLLRSECVVIMHTFINALHRWMSEDPKSYAAEVRQAAVRHRRTTRGSGSGDAGYNIAEEWVEAYLDDWDAAEAGEGDGTAAVVAANGAAGAPGTSDRVHTRGAPHEDAPLPQAARPASASLRSANNAAASTSTATTDRSLQWSGAVPSVVDGTHGLAAWLWGHQRHIGYHWKHIHHLLQNKRVTQRAAQLVNMGEWQTAMHLLAQCGYFDQLAPPSARVWNDDGQMSSEEAAMFACMAQFLHEYPGISRNAVSALFEKVNKGDEGVTHLLHAFLRYMNYANVPIDLALRDTTCTFVSWDRPMFEAQVWATIQTMFGDEYARQNSQVISAKDADTMAGVLLFLHANQHNESARSTRMSCDVFVASGNACLDIPFEEEDMKAMYDRVSQHKWALDAYDQTPRVAARRQAVVRLSAMVAHKVIKYNYRTSTDDKAAPHNTPRRSTSAALCDETRERLMAGVASAATPQPTPNSSGTQDAAGGAKPSLLTSPLASVDSEALPREECAEETPPPLAAAAAATDEHVGASPQRRALRVHMREAALLDAGPPSYCDNRDSVRLREERPQTYLAAAYVYLAKLELLHRRYYMEQDEYRPQPYVIPYYAEHVRMIVLLTYPHVLACLYMGLRVLEEAPIVRQVLHTFHLLYNIAAALQINLGDLRPAVDEVIQRYLSDEQSYHLLPPTRATFVPFLCNAI